jgi:tRNA U34 2-thiouridine synthase MnmA/TrmU
VHIQFDQPQFAVTPGQAVVCYDIRENQRVLGGGWIE